MRYVLVLLFCATFTQAAPVPKAKPFDRDSMVGTWKYDWGTALEGGFITLNKDGTYYARHEPSKPHAWLGEWRYEEGNYIFRERSLNEKFQLSEWSAEYKMKVDSSKFGQWSATSTFTIKFSNRKVTED
jgi:hypothetical protein